MGQRPISAASLAAVALAALCCVFSRAQTAAPPPPAPCTTSPQPTSCVPPVQTPSKAGPSQRFPFPGEEPASAAPDSGGPATTPNAPANAHDAPAATKRFPFPGEDPAAAGGSSSSSSSTDPDQPADPDAASTPDKAAPDKPKPDAPSGRRLLKRVNPPGTKLQSPEERVAEDLDIAKFYLSTGDLQGAYLRSEDAVKLAPDAPDAHCSLAETALKLNKRDQAITEFNACLKLDPEEKLAKNARKQLAKLN